MILKMGQQKHFRSYPAKFFAMEINIFFYFRKNNMNKIATGFVE